MATCGDSGLCLVVLVVMAMVIASRSQTSEVTYSIKEELAPGTVFGYLVDDSDLRRQVGPDELNNLRFSFLTRGNPHSKYFSIGKKSGVLSVASRIDRETVCSFRADCMLSVSAVVQSELGPFFHVVTVQVEVTDVNDNTPTFSQSDFHLTIPENAALGRTFPLPTAFDRDTGRNNTVRDYFLVSGQEGPFALRTTQDDAGSMHTALQLVRELNREHTAAIKVLVGARDGGKPSLTGTLTVRVDIADVNDNAPVFDHYAYDVNVTETTRVVDPLLRVYARDADAGANGNLSYSFSPLQPQEVLDLFRMEEFTGIMYLAHSVENHTGRIFELVVEAHDQGMPPKVARALVRVRVLDTVNSRPDVIVDILSSSPDGQAEVSEYAEVGKVVAYVSVTDRDSGDNGVTVCRLNTNEFELQPLNNHGQYKVILVTRLDRERISRYQISVGCQDFGFPPLETTKTFQVNVRDENDNAPTFSSRTYYASVLENVTEGAAVASLTVNDADLGDNADVMFRVVGAMHQKMFRVTDNGTLIATATLDRETAEKLMVKVVAVDKGNPPLSGSATVLITLEDVNDMPPRFSHRGRYSFSVPENARVGAFVGLVAADDQDLGINAEVSFTAGLRRNGNSAGNLPFQITKDGVVKTTRGLDRERRDLYYFPVVAVDGGSPPLSSTTTLTIHVDDVNDNTPVFLYPSEMNDSVSIPHTYPVRTPITQIRATDRDSGQNAVLIYSSSSNNDTRGAPGGSSSSSQLFGVNPTTGHLYLTRYLSSRQLGLYVLRVAAHDEGTPQLSNQTLLFVEVYFDNSTLFDAAQAAAPTRALVTVLVVVGVVLVLAVVVVSALICIRRQDARRKKAESASGGIMAGGGLLPPPNPAKLQGGYYIAPGVCESPAFGNSKPVPEQNQNQTLGSLRGSVGLNSDVSTLRASNPYVIMPPHSNFTDPEGPPEIIEISRNGLFHRAEDPCPDDDDDVADDSRFSTFRSIEGVLNSSFRQNSLHRNSVDTVDEDKQADDTLSLSDLSCQSTSDSGRGGSEFDVTNAGHKDPALKRPLSTSSPLANKGPNSTNSNNNNNTNNVHSGAGAAVFRPRDPSFTTFRGDSPSSFRFDSEGDTLKRAQGRSPSVSSTSGSGIYNSINSSSTSTMPTSRPASQSHPMSPKLTLNAQGNRPVSGHSPSHSPCPPPSSFRPTNNHYYTIGGTDPATCLSDSETGSTSTHSWTRHMRRAATPASTSSAETNPRYGYLPSNSSGGSAVGSSFSFRRGSAGGSEGVYGSGLGMNAERAEAASLLSSLPSSTSTSSTHHPHHPQLTSQYSSPLPSAAEFRGRNFLARSLSGPRSSSTITDYANAYSDLDSDNDTSQLENSESERLLPAHHYPAVPEEGEDDAGEVFVSDRSALASLTSRLASTSSRSNSYSDYPYPYRGGRSSEL